MLSFLETLGQDIASFKQRHRRDHNWCYLQKGVIDLILYKPKAVRKKATSSKKKKKYGKAGDVEVNTRIGTRNEHFLKVLSNVMSTLDNYGMKDRYLVMDNATIHKVHKAQI